MTPEAFKEYLEVLNKTQVGFAREIEVDPRTVRRWASGEKPVPKVVELLLSAWMRCNR